MFIFDVFFLYALSPSINFPFTCAGFQCCFSLWILTWIFSSMLIPRQSSIHYEPDHVLTPLLVPCISCRLFPSKTLLTRGAGEKHLISMLQQDLAQSFSLDQTKVAHLDLDWDWVGARSLVVDPWQLLERGYLQPICFVWIEPKVIDIKEKQWPNTPFHLCCAEKRARWALSWWELPEKSENFRWQSLQNC